MYFCPIAPTVELDRYAGRSYHQLCLAQFARGTDAGSRAYFEWYRGRASSGDVVILDNGAYESATFNPDEYLRLARELRPEVLTLPDKVGDYEETRRLIRDFPRPRIDDTWQEMVVVQQDPRAALIEWIDAYRETRNYPCEWVALPRVLAARRIELIYTLRKLGLWQLDIQHHAFGMNAGSLAELPALNTLGVYTCDSSAPVWRGLNGYHINSTSEWEDYPFNPDANLDAACGNGAEEYAASVRALADANLTEVLNACQSTWEIPSTFMAAPIS